MSKHTPGPWEAINSTDVFTPLGAQRADGTEMTIDDGWGIADCDLGGLPIDEAKANARLISAAPEMLEALKEMVERFDSCRELLGLDASSLSVRARAAIAKAEGEQ